MLKLTRFPVGVATRWSMRTLATEVSQASGHPQPQPSATGSEGSNETLKKFWTKVDLVKNDSSYELQLDNKSLRTPLGNNLSIPLSRGVLAHMLLHEWSSLSGVIKTHSLPLTSLTSRAIDLKFANEQNDEQAITKVGKRSDIIEMLLRYLDTDTLLVFSPAKEYEGTLRKAQEDLYRPVIKSVEGLLGGQLSYLDSDRDGLRGNRQSDETRAKAREWLNALSYWDLVAFEKVTLTTKSFICGVLVVCSKSSHGLSHPQLNISLEEIAHLASLEIVYQTERWGEVEDTHDVDYQDLRRNINSAAMLCYEERA